VDIPREKTAPADPQRLGWPQSQSEVSALVDAYAGRLVRYAFRRLGDYQDAEDVVQQVFVRALVERSGHRAVSTSAPICIGRSAMPVLDLLRKRNSAAVMREKVGREEAAEGSDDPAEIAQAAEGLRRAESLLAACPRSRPKRSACVCSTVCR